MRYEQRLRARRVGGALAPALLLPLAAWVWVAAPPAPPPAASGAPPTASTGPGPGSVQPGSVQPESVRVTATAHDDGSFTVVEDVTYRGPVTAIDLRAPQVTIAGPQFEQVRPVVVDLQVSGGGAVARPPVPTGPTTVALTAPAASVQVSYRWSGSAVETAPSPPGRALAALAPVADPAGAGVWFRVDGPGVRNLSCPLAVAGTATCAVGEGSGLATGSALPAGRAVVVVQVDLT